MTPSDDPRFAPSEVSNYHKVAWVTLGLVVYLQDSLVSCWDDFLGAYDALMARPWAANLTHLARSDRMGLHPVDPQRLQWYRMELERGGRTSPQIAGELSDGSALPITSLSFRDVESSHIGAFPRCSSVLIRLPMDTHVDEISHACRVLGDALPIDQAIAGYLCHADANSRGAGFDQAWAWARRYYGLHVVEPVAVTWDAPKGLCGTNWITLVSEQHMEGAGHPDPSALPKDIRVEQLRNAMLYQAGAAPNLGDQNLGQALPAYSAVSSALLPAFVNQPSSYPGMFTDLQCTDAWLRRLHDPVAFRDCA